MSVPAHAALQATSPDTGLIDTQRGLDLLIDALTAAPVVAVDCEMDAMFAYRTSLCLVQVGWEGGEALVDAMAGLRWQALDALFQDDGTVKVFHGGENDIGLMAAHWSLGFRNVFDTAAAAQVVGRDRVGLAALLSDHFGVEVSKKFQRADWRVRPLPAEQAEYARLDVRYLLPLRRLLLDELERLGRVEEAESEFERIRRVRAEERPFDRDAWVRVKGARELPAKRRGVLAAVFAARDDIARRLDRAPYRVARDHVLIELARRLPRDLAQLRRIKGIPRDIGEDEVLKLVAAVNAGARVPDEPLPKPPRRGNRTGPGPLTPEQQQTFDRLRAWRARRAKRRGVLVARVATNALLTAIVRADPRDAGALAAVEGMEAWRLREYGEELLAALAEGRR